MGQVINACKVSTNSDQFFSGGQWMCYIRSGLMMQHVLLWAGVVWGVSLPDILIEENLKFVNYERALKIFFFSVAVVKKL